MRIELVHDFICVHSYLAFTRLRRALGEHLAAGGRAHLVLRPYQARPDAPVEGEPLFTLHRRERGEATARAIRADRTLGAADGLDFRFDRALFTNTFPAHHLVARAAAQGLALPMTERLFRAYFTDGLHLADPAVLAELAARAGVRPGPDRTAEVRAELARNRTLGSPTGPVFLVDGRRVLHEAPTQAEIRACLAGRAR